MGLLDGKVAIVTGGGGGFGKGIAEKFVKEGAKVIITDFVEDVGQKTAGEIKAEFVRADVSKRADWEAVVKHVDEKFGKIDIVINNAGTTYRNKVISIPRREKVQMLTVMSLPTTLRTRILTR
jgi:NAD(P)-dependent dehydrogenase (short-subunit alcohol dehydrogenase family)